MALHSVVFVRMIPEGSTNRNTLIYTELDKVPKGTKSRAIDITIFSVSIACHDPDFDLA